MAGDLRVAIIGPYPGPDGIAHGGVEAVTSALGDGLAIAGGIDVHVVTSVRGAARHETRITPAGVTVHAVPLFGKLGCLTGFAVDVKRLSSTLEKINPDIVHAHTHVVYARASARSTFPSVLTIHGIYYKEASAQGGWTGLHMRFICRYERDALRRAKHIICLNRYTADSFRGLISTEDIRFIDNPVDDRFFDVENREEEGRVILIAAVRRLKGIEYLIKAASKLRADGKRVDVHCVGPVIEVDYMQELKHLVAESHLEECIHFQDTASKEQVMEHYSRAAVVVLPSMIENAPMVVSEAMAAGKPVVATPVGGIPEMVEDGRTGCLVPFGNSADLAAAIGRLLDDAQLRRRIGEAARSVAEQRFRQRAVVEKTLAFYRDIISSEGKRAS